MTTRGRIPIQATAENNVYPYIVDYYNKYGYMPTLEEIGGEFEKTKQWARSCLQHLEEKGKIRIIKSKLRGIELT